MDSCFIDFEIVAMLFLSTLCVMAIILCMVLLSKSKEVTQERRRTKTKTKLKKINNVRIKRKSSSNN
jgi:energy-converting hydrogenase Eha subunit H